MNGCLIKDILTSKSMFKTYALLFLLYSFNLFTGNYSLFLTIVFVFAISSNMFAFTIDAQSHWDSFAAALPDGRRQMVRGRYQFALLLAAIYTVLGLAAFGLFRLLGYSSNVSFKEFLVAALSADIATLLLTLVLYPVLFRFGVSKGRVIMTATTGLITGCVAAAVVVVKDGRIPLHIPQISLPSWAIGAAAIALLAAAYAISYHCSLRVCQKREY